MEGALAHPEWIGPVVLGVGISLVGVAAARAVARHRAQLLLGAEGPRLVRGLGRDVALLLGLGAVGVALLGPRLGARIVQVVSSGIDAVLVLDVSPSMLAEDVPPNRLARAHEVARQVLGRLAPDDRAALAAFSGRGVLLTPLTPDRAALVAMLPALDPDLMRDRASRIGDGLQAALGAFESGSDRPRVVLVLSDGEDPNQESVSASGASRVGARVIAVTFGTEEGATVPARGGPLEDSAGRIVVSRRQAEPLGRLAGETDGLVFAADRWGSVDVAGVVRAVRRDAGRTPGERVERRIPRVWVAPFAGFAFLVLALELAGAGQRVRRIQTVGALGLLLVILGASGTSAPRVASELEERVRAEPEDARALVALAVARAELGDRDEAARALFAAAARARDSRLASLAYYDLGVIEIERGRLEAARDAFFDALALRPDDLEARFNLEWTIRALRSVPPPPSGGGEGSREPTEPPSEPDAEATAGKAAPEPTERDPPAPTASKARRSSAPDLSAEEVERWLEEVTDDPRHSLREAARRAAAGKPRLPRDTARW